MQARDPYGKAHIRRGAAYLIGGKAITSVAGIGTFVILVRALPVEQFAAYTVLFGLVELIDAITAVGLTQVLARYVPELHVGQQAGSLCRLVAYALAARMLVLSCFLALVFGFSSALLPYIGLAGWEWAFHAYLLVALFRVASISLFTVLESMLYQRSAQLGFGSVTVTRVILLAWFASGGMLDLETVIRIELATELIGSTIMLFAVVRGLPRRGPDGAHPSAWLQENFARMSVFGMKGFLQHLLILPYGGSVNRLLVGGALATPEVAWFGFAQSIADLMERYLPVRLLAGVIRPVLTARYVRDGKFRDLEVAGNVIFKINASLVCLASVVVFAGGVPLVAVITGGKYSENSVALLLLMCALVFMYSFRYMLDHLSNAVEMNGPLAWSNAVITASVIPGFLLLPVFGVYALPAANLVGLVAGSAVLVSRLRRAGFIYRYDLLNVAVLLGATAGSALAAELVRLVGSPWPVTVAAALVVFPVLLLLLRPWSGEERVLALSLVRRA